MRRRRRRTKEDEEEEEEEEKEEEEEEEYDFDNTNYYENIRVNEDPEFLDPFQNKLQIPNLSPSDGAGIISGNLFLDILGTTRSDPPDLGAYESTVFDN